MSTFECPFRKSAQKPIKKHYVFHYSLMQFRNFARHHFSVGKTWFCGAKKKEPKYLINTVVYEAV